MRGLVAVVMVVSAPAVAGTSAPDGGVAPAPRGQRAIDELRSRLQTNEQVAANLTPDERVLLLSGIICDAEDKAGKARDAIRHERTRGATAGSIDHDQQAVVRQQQARIAHARRALGRSKPTACTSAAMRAVVGCMRGKAGPVNGPSPDCDIPGFWKYRRALLDLDSQWHDLLFPRDDGP